MKRKEYREAEWIFPFVMYENFCDTSDRLPLIVQLHGAGERGNGKDDLYKVDVNGFSGLIKDDTTHKCLVVMPQCPSYSFWAGRVESILAFIDQIVEKFPVDEDRIYLTGMSMGGFGTWFTAMAHPGRFAAIAPVCGGGMSWNAGVLKMPVWAFHGEADNVVPEVYSRLMVDKMRECGLDVRYTPLPGVGHNAWSYTYDLELMEWLLSKTKGSK